MLEDDNDANAAHKTREDRVGDVADIFAEFDDAEKYLEEAAEDGCQSHGDENSGKNQVGRVAGECLSGGNGTGDEGCGDDGHGAGGTGNLAVGATEESGEESEEGGASEAYIGTQ